MMDLEGLRGPHGRRAAYSLVAVAGAGMFAGLLVVREPLLALGAGGILVIASVFAVSSRKTPREVTTATYGWIAPAWLVLFFISNHQLNPERTPLDAASGLASAYNLIEVAAYGAIALAIAVAWNVPTRSGAEPLRLGWYIVWPLVAVASTAWSLIPFFSMVRSLQLIVPLLLAVLLARIWRAAPAVGAEIWARTLRWLVIAASLFGVFGWLVRGSTLGLFKGRFTWPGMHPVEAGLIFAVAVVILLVGGRSLSRLPVALHWALIGLLSYSLYLTQTRIALGALAVAIFVALLLPTRRDASARYLAMVYYVAAVLVAATFAYQPIVEYLSRGETTEVFTTFNGRIPLWAVVISEVTEAGTWIAGSGYGSARVLLFTSVEWAGTAHNAWFELFVGVGLIGASIAAVGVLQLGYRVVLLARRWDARAKLAATLFTFLFVASFTTPGFALPGFSYTLLSAIYALYLGMWNSRETIDRAETTPVAVTRRMTGRLPAGTTRERSPTLQAR